MVGTPGRSGEGPRFVGTEYPHARLFVFVYLKVVGNVNEGHTTHRAGIGLTPPR